MKEKRKLKDIALELLEKYKHSEEGVIWEYGAKHMVALYNLEAEIQKYKAEIEAEIENANA